MTTNALEKDRFLVIKGKAGLGNRMLSAVTGLVYADISNRIPTIDWRDGSYAPPGTNAYPLLFETPITVDPAQLDDEDNVAPAIWRNNLGRSPSELIARLDPKRHSDPFIYRKYCIDLGRLDESARVGVFWSYLPKLEKLPRTAVRDRWPHLNLQQITRSYLGRYFRLQPWIARKLQDLLQPLRRPIIGVHIRFSDLRVPVDKIEAQLKAARIKLSGSTIFLATDNADIETRIKQAFGDVYCLKKWFPRVNDVMHQNPSNPDPIGEAANALVDMYALAQCDQLIYSSHSTFAVASKLLGDMTDSRTYDIDRYSPVLILRNLINRIA
jgi:hypothetical protein